MPSTPTTLEQTDAGQARHSLLSPTSMLLQDALNSPISWDHVDGPHLITDKNKKIVDFSLGIGPDRILGPEDDDKFLADCLEVLKSGRHMPGIPGYSPLHEKLALSYEKPYAEAGAAARVLGFFKSSSEANTAAIRCARLLALDHESRFKHGGGDPKRTKILRCGFLGWHDIQMAASPAWHEQLNCEKRYISKSPALASFCLASDNEPDFVDWVDLKLRTLEQLLREHGDSLALFMFDVYQLAMIDLSTESEAALFLQEALEKVKTAGVLTLLDETKTAGRVGAAGCMAALYPELCALADFHVLGKGIGNGLPLSVLMARVPAGSDSGEDWSFAGRQGLDALEALVANVPRIGSTHSKEMLSAAAALAVIDTMCAKNGYTRLKRICEQVVGAFNEGFRRAGCGAPRRGELGGDDASGVSTPITVASSTPREGSEDEDDCKKAPEQEELRYFPAKTMDLLYARPLFDNSLFELVFSSKVVNDHGSRASLQKALCKHGVFVLQGHNSFVGLTHEGVDFQDLTDRIQRGTEEWLWGKRLCLPASLPVSTITTSSSATPVSIFNHLALQTRCIYDACLTLSDALVVQNRELDGKKDWDAIKNIGGSVATLLSTAFDVATNSTAGNKTEFDSMAKNTFQRLLRHIETVADDFEAEMGSKPGVTISDVWKMDETLILDGIWFLKTDKITVELHVWNPNSSSSVSNSSHRSIMAPPVHDMAPHEHGKSFFSVPIVGDAYRHHIWMEVPADQGPVDRSADHTSNDIDVDDSADHSSADHAPVVDLDAAPYAYFFYRDDEQCAIHPLTDSSGQIPMVLQPGLSQGGRQYWISSKMIHSVELVVEGGKLHPGLCTLVIQDSRTSNRMRVFQRTKDGEDMIVRERLEGRTAKDGVYGRIGECLWGNYGWAREHAIR